MVTAVRRADAAGIKSSVIVLLGLGGKDLRDRHVEGTVAALNRMQPRYLSFLTLMLVPGTPLDRQAERGEFELPGQEELLREARDIIAGLELEGTIFRTNHASNYLPLAGRFPQDKDALLSSLRAAMDGKTPLRPEAYRGL
jgi:radical SAM superfamily enzyme